MSMMKNKMNNFLSYLRLETGALAVAFAMAIPVVFGMAGFSIDVSNAYLVKQRLSHAVDAAALAAAASTSSTSTLVELNNFVQQFFTLNYPEDKIGAAYDVEVTVEDNNIMVSASADYETVFAAVVGIDTMNIGASSTVTREILGLEVAMVLDVTGSMSSNNNIGTLRTAATNFTNILFASAAYPDSVKIGLVPFSASVNVGPYGLGYLPSSSDSRKASTTKYDGGTAFVNNPSKYKFDQTSSSQWWGCILERPSPQDTQDQKTGTAWKWDMYRYNTSGAKSWSVRGDSAAVNTSCNKNYILPLTSVKSTVLNRISKFTADGNTLSNVGMVWGYRLLSPEAPFREGVAWGTPEWRKVAILMTDGDNNNGEIYNAYGPYNTLKVTDSMLDSKLAQTCTNMKNDGITVYTVTFTSGINQATKDFFKNCASSPDKWYDAPSQDDLTDAFEQIARELSNIHLSN